MQQPPIGVFPKWVHQERRLAELNQAIDRYINANMLISADWLDERDEIITYLSDRANRLIKKPEVLENISILNPVYETREYQIFLTGGDIVMENGMKIGNVSGDNKNSIGITGISSKY